VKVLGLHPEWQARSRENDKALADLSARRANGSRSHH